LRVSGVCFADPRPLPPIPSAGAGPAAQELSVPEKGRLQEARIEFNRNSDDCHNRVNNLRVPGPRKRDQVSGKVGIKSDLETQRQGLEARRETLKREIGELKLRGHALVDGIDGGTQKKDHLAHFEQVVSDLRAKCSDVTALQGEVDNWNR
jgi:hypothetical protein